MSLDILSAPPTQVLTDLEFIFLGMPKALVHVITESDIIEDRGDHWYIRWNDVGEDALIYKQNLIQFGRRVRLVSKEQKTAVQKVVEEIRLKEAQAQGSTGQASLAETVSQPATGAAVPSNLWDRSPLKR